VHVSGNGTAATGCADAQKHIVSQEDRQLMRLDDLHDAVLERIGVQTEDGCITVTLSPVQLENAPKRVVLVAHGFEHFVFPRKQPWGLVKVWYVNRVHGPFSVGPTMQGLEIEMQSGDVIEMHATTFERIDESASDG
jgi:hypothetical protein